MKRKSFVERMLILNDKVRHDSSYVKSKSFVERMLILNDKVRHDSSYVKRKSFVERMRVLKTGYAAIAQLVERIHGKDEVLGSNPSRGSIFMSEH